MKSGIGLRRPPGEDASVAKAHILCHLLMILLTEPLLADQSRRPSPPGGRVKNGGWRVLRLVARTLLAEIDVPGASRPLTVANTPLRMSETPGGVHRRAPLAGEETDRCCRSSASARTR